MVVRGVWAFLAMLMLMRMIMAVLSPHNLNFKKSNFFGLSKSLFIKMINFSFGIQKKYPYHLIKDKIYCNHLDWNPLKPTGKPFIKLKMDKMLANP